MELSTDPAQSPEPSRHTDSPHPMILDSPEVSDDNDSDSHTISQPDPNVVSGDGLTNFKGFLDTLDVESARVPSLDGTATTKTEDTNSVSTGDAKELKMTHFLDIEYIEGEPVITQDVDRAPFECLCWFLKAKNQCSWNPDGPKGKDLESWMEHHFEHFGRAFGWPIAARCMFCTQSWTSINHKLNYGFLFTHLDEEHFAQGTEFRKNRHLILHPAHRPEALYLNLAATGKISYQELNVLMKCGNLVGMEIGRPASDQTPA